MYGSIAGGLRCIGERAAAGGFMTYGYIFDFDGVLVKTMEMHYEAYKRAMEEAGVPIVRDQFFRQAGMTGREQIKYFADLAGVEADVEKIYRRKGELAQDHPERAARIECNLALLRTLRAAGVPAAIATGSSRPSIIPIMKKFRIEVDAIASSEDVKRGKPNPDLFLFAAEKLGVEPRNCVVVEDSDVGIEAARAAGMKALRFYDNGG
jgi:HAD superfamily hydrolase (TIGR01509 family)